MGVGYILGYGVGFVQFSKILHYFEGSERVPLPGVMSGAGTPYIMKGPGNLE